MKDQYDLAFYLDSDAALSLAYPHSLTMAMQQWRRIGWGVRDLSQSAMVFFPATPFGDREPNVGAIVFRPAYAKDMIREWYVCFYRASLSIYLSIYLSIMYAIHTLPFMYTCNLSA
jgi:hypothetical protein